MSSNNTGTSGPTSQQGAINHANGDSNAGRGPANTTGWNDSARQTYESQFNWNNSQGEKKSS